MNIATSNLFDKTRDRQFYVFFNDIFRQLLVIIIGYLNIKSIKISIKTDVKLY